MNLPTIETLKKSIFRGVEVALVAGFTSLVAVPLNIADWKDFRTYGIAALFAFLVGVIAGIVKFIKGYVKYDL